MKVVVKEAGIEKIHYPEGKIALVGRSSQCHLKIDNDHISRKHLELIERDGAVFVKDLTLSNWVSISGKKMEKDIEVEVFDFIDILLPGDVILNVSAGGPEDENSKERNFNFDLPEEKKTKSKAGITKPTKLKLEKDIYRDLIDHSKTAKDGGDLEDKPLTEKQKANDYIQFVKLFSVFLVGALAVMYFFEYKKGFSEKKQPQSKVKVEKKSSNRTKIKTSKPKIKTDKRVVRKSKSGNLAVVESFLKNNEKCTGVFQAICEKIVPMRSINEGVISDGNTIIVIKNFDNRLQHFFQNDGNGYKKAMNNIATEKVLSGEMSLEPKFLKALEKRKYVEIKVIMISVVQGRIKVRSAYTIDTSYYRRYSERDYNLSIENFRKFQDSSFFDKTFERYFIKEK